MMTKTKRGRGWLFTFGFSVTVCFCFLLFVGPVKAQIASATATVNGIVEDSSGAVIAGATVVVHSLARNEDKTTYTNATGNYVLLNIPPGPYTLKVSKEGFTIAEVAEFSLSVNQTASFNLTLQVGSTRQTVTVQATGANIQTSTSELGTVITTTDVADIPLNGRNFSQLLILIAGSSPVNVSQNAGGGNVNAIGTFESPAMNGQVNRSNYFTLDGINDLEPQANDYSLAPIVDDIQEFKVQSHNDDPQFGGVLGGYINVVTKGGTTAFHGAGWEFLRNNALDSRNFFFPDVSPLKQNNFGANIGGPVILPHYNGLNRTFFFGSYEGYRVTQSAQTTYLVPTADQLGGDLSTISGQIYNPLSTLPDPANPGEWLRDSFMCDESGNPEPATNGIQTAGTPCNKIPSSMIDPNALKYARVVFPAAISTSNPNINGVDTQPTHQLRDQYSVRIDEQINATNSAWFRFTRARVRQNGNAGLATLNSFLNQQAFNLGASFLHTFNPSTTLQASYGRNILTWAAGTFFPGAPAGFTSSLGLSNNWACSFLPQVSASKCLIPDMSISGFAGGGQDTYNNTPANVSEWKADFAHIHGRHTIKAGLDILTSHFTNYAGNEDASFTSFQTANLETGAGGSALASFLLGVPDSADYGNVVTTQHPGMETGYYIQDQWKATDKLTVNLGFRYDITYWPRYGNVAHNNNVQGDLDLNNGVYYLQAIPPSCESTGKAPCIPGGTLPAHVELSPIAPRIFHNGFDNWQPRLGLAYRLNQKTALRASAGRVYDNWSAVTQLGQNYGGAWPRMNAVYALGLNQTTVTRTFEDPLGLGSGAQFLPDPTPFNQVNYYVDPHLQMPYSDQWNLGLQRELGANTVVSANYVGSHNSREDVSAIENTAPTPGPGDPSLRYPIPYITPTHFDKSIGRSNYNAFQLSLNKKASRGLSYLIAYTWSKSMDIGCSGFFGVEGCSIQDWYNLDNNKSVSAFDLTHMLNVSWVYELPLGKGKALTSHNRVIDYAFGNWQVNGVLTLSSGPPYSLQACGDIANVGNSGCRLERLDQTSDPKLSNPGPPPGYWFNVNAVATPARYTWGNMGRNTLRGDWLRNFDFSLFKVFPVTETKRFELRGEAFNLFNLHYFGTPDNIIGDPSFGQVTTASPQRIIQLGLKFYY